MSDQRHNLTRTLSQSQPQHHLKYNSEDRVPPRTVDSKPPKKTFYYKMPGEKELEDVPHVVESKSSDKMFLQPTIGGFEDLKVSNGIREDSKGVSSASLNQVENNPQPPMVKSPSMNSIPRPNAKDASQIPVMANNEQQMQMQVAAAAQYVQANQMQQNINQSQSNPNIRQHLSPKLGPTNSNPQMSVNQHQTSPASDTNSYQERRPSEVSSGYSFDVQQIQPQSQTPMNQFAAGDTQPTHSTLQMYREQLKKTNDPISLLEFSKYLIQMSEQVLSEKGNPQQLAQKQKQLQAEALKYIKKVTQNKISNLNEQQKTAVSEGLVFLAECYGSGALGVNVDHEKAFSLYLQASKINHPQATYRVAVCNELGAGCKRDSNRAVQYFRKSAALGDVAGMYKMGLIMLNGLLGQQRNPREAISWLKRAAQVADGNNPHALHELGLIYEKEGIPNVIPDENYARDLFTQAAFLGYAPSQYRLGYIYEYGTLGCPIDPRRSIAWYTKAAQQGHPDSELALSGWYLTGADGVLQRSDTEAYLWARKAADKGLAKAEYAVGYYSEMGIGVKKDIEEARRWYVRAASQGNQRSMQRLNELKKIRGMQRKDDENCVIM